MAGVVTETPDLQVPDGQMATFSYRPEGDGKFPAVIVVQEIFGVDPHIQDVAQRFANEGYFATAPDLFHRSGPKIVVPYGEMQTGFGYRQQMTDEGIVDDLSAVVQYLRNQPSVDADHIGIVGFCFGGRVSFLAAARVAGIGAAAVYYGGGIVPRADAAAGTPNLLDEAKNISCPVIGFFGDQDQGIPVDQVSQIEQALKNHRKDVQVQVYAGAGHGFFCDGRGSYHEASAKDAWVKTVDFFGQHLKGSTGAG